MSNYSRRLELRLTQFDYDRLQVQADELGLSVSQVARLLIQMNHNIAAALQESFNSAQKSPSMHTSFVDDDWPEPDQETAREAPAIREKSVRQLDRSAFADDAAYLASLNNLFDPE